MEITKAMKDEQQKLKAKYLHLLETESPWINDHKMINYCLEKVSWIIEVNVGLLIIEKPYITTDFPVGYHACVGYTEYEDAEKTAEAIKKSKEFFFNKNLYDFDFIIKSLKEDKGWLTRTMYFSCPIESELRSLERNYFDRPKQESDVYLSKDEIKKIIVGYEIARELFLKRLNAYFKRYGLSKIKSWTYWLDE